MGWIHLPVSTTGSGPVSNNQASPTDWSSFEFRWQFYEGLEEKSKLLGGCAAEYPPPSTYWASGTIDSGVTTNFDGDNPVSLSFTITGLNSAVPSEGPCSGSTSRWSGYGCGECLPNIPSEYDLVSIKDYNDPWTWTRLKILSNTYDSGSNITTLTTEYLPGINAVVAKFIDSLDDLAGCQYRITKHRDVPGAGCTSRDRRPLKPNQKELWRGTTIVNGWVDSDGNGQFQEINNAVNPSPYDGGPPPIKWGQDKWKAKEVLFFDATGLLQRQTITGNDLNHVGFGDSNFQVTITALDVFTLTTPNGSTTQSFDADATTIQTNLENIGYTGHVTVTGTGPFEISFNSSLGYVGLSAVGATIDAPDGTTAISGSYIITDPGCIGAPGRIPEPELLWYGGDRQSYVSITPGAGIGSCSKPTFTKDWDNGDICSEQGCNSVQHNTFDVDAKYEDDNNCVGSDAGNWVAWDYYLNWRHLQQSALSLLQQFVDTSNPFGGKPVINLWTPATWASEFGLASAWTSSVTYSGSVANVGTPTIPVQTYPLNVYYTVQDSGSNKKSGTGSIDESGVISNGSFDSTDNGLTIYLWAGNTRSYRRRHKYAYPKVQWLPDCGSDGCEDPPAITPGGELDNPDAPTLATAGTGGTLNYNTTYAYVISALNGSGETMASAEATILTYDAPIVDGVATPITTNTYIITLTWTPELGASSYNIYGRTTGDELLLANVSAYLGTWTDDGTLTPSGALPTSNTTSTDCFGTGLWNSRDISTSHLSVTTDGFVSDGGAAFTTGVLSRFTGDNPSDTFSGRGPITASLDDEDYFIRYFRGKYPKSIELARHAHQAGQIKTGTKYSIFDPLADWWNDGVNSGTIRVQGGLLTSGGDTTVGDSDYSNTGTSKACWFATNRFIGSLGGVAATPYSFFIIEIYSGGTPAGWTIAEDGTTTYSAPTPTGNSGTITTGTPPTITGTTPTLLHATGFAQPMFVQGDNFQADCVVTLTAPDDTTTIIDPTTITAGELSLSVVFDRDQWGTWSIVASNPTGGDSNSFDFDVLQVQSIPVASFSAGVFTLNGTLETAAAINDCYFLREPKYELSRHRGRVVEVTPPTGDPYQLVCRYSDDSGLYFDEQDHEIVGTYAIQEIATGATLLLSEDKPTAASGLAWCEAPGGLFWVQPSGTDSRASVTFRNAINYNAETGVKDYGFFSLLDDYSKDIPNELYDMIISMTKTPQGYSWSWTACGGTGQNFAGYGVEEGFDYTPCSGAPPFGTWPIADQIACMRGVMATAATCLQSDPTQCGVGAYDFFIDNGTSDGAVPHNSTSFEAVFIIDDQGRVCQTEIPNVSTDAAENYAKVNGACYPFASNIDFYTYGDLDGANSSFTETFDEGPGALAQGSCNSNATYDDCKLIVTGATIFDNAGNPVSFHEWEQWGSATSTAFDTDDICSSSPLGNLSSIPTLFGDPTIAPPAGPSEQDESDYGSTLGWYPLAIIAIRTWEDLVYV